MTIGEASPSFAALSAVIAWRRSSGTAWRAKAPVTTGTDSTGSVGVIAAPTSRASSGGQAQDPKRREAPDGPHQEHAWPEGHGHLPPVRAHPALRQPGRGAGHGDGERHASELAQHRPRRWDGRRDPT